MRAVSNAMRKKNSPGLGQVRRRPTQADGASFWPRQEPKSPRWICQCVRTLCRTQPPWRNRIRKPMRQPAFQPTAGRGRWTSKSRHEGIARDVPRFLRNRQHAIPEDRRAMLPRNLQRISDTPRSITTSPRVQFCAQDVVRRRSATMQRAAVGDCKISHEANKKTGCGHKDRTPNWRSQLQDLPSQTRTA